MLSIHWLVLECGIGDDKELAAPAGTGEEYNRIGTPQSIERINILQATVSFS